MQGPASVARSSPAARLDGDAHHDRVQPGFEQALADEVARRSPAREPRTEPEASADDERERPPEDALGLARADAPDDQRRAFATETAGSTRAGAGHLAAHGRGVLLGAEGAAATPGEGTSTPPLPPRDGGAVSSESADVVLALVSDDETDPGARALRAAARASTAEPDTAAIASATSDISPVDEDEIALEPAELDLGLDDPRQQIDARAPDPARAMQRVNAADADRGVADQLADAVRRLAAESLERTDLVRFRAQGHTFAALVAHDGQHAQLRLLADDPGTRAFLGERLPEVRQALERVGFASTGLSVAADAEHRHGHHQRDPARDDAGEPAPTATSPARTRGGSRADPPHEPKIGDPRRLDLIL